MKARGLSQAELARRVGVSRQAVSLWLKQPDYAELKSRHLVALAEVLGVEVQRLVTTLPGFEPNEHDRAMATLLWDRAFEDLDDLAIAALQGDPRAVARIVEVHGLYATEKMLGESVSLDFQTFGRYVHPARRSQLEAVHRWRQSRAAA